MHIEQQLYEAFIVGDIQKIDKIFLAKPRLKKKRMIAGGNWIYSIGPKTSMEVVEYLIEIGLDPHEKAKQEGDNCLTSAAREGRDDLVSFLLYLGVEIDTTLSVRNPLFAAVGASIGQWGDGAGTSGNPEKVIEILLEAGIDPWIEYKSPTMNGLNAAAHALNYDMQDIAELIIRLSANGDNIVSKKYWRLANEARDRQKIKSPYSDWIEHS